MTRSVVAYYEQQDLLYESFFEDVKKKLSSINFLESVSKKIENKISSHQKNIKRVEDELKSKGVDTISIRDVATKHAKIAFESISRKKSFEQNAKIVRSNFENAITEIKENVALSTGDLKKDVLISILIFVFLFIIITFLIYLIKLFIKNDAVVDLITVVFFAPLFEEISKMASIKQNVTGAYFILFNTFEFFNYVIKYVSQGYNFVGIALLRILPIIMHLITTTIQYMCRKIAVSTNSPVYENIGLVAGILVHFFWNLNAYKILINNP